MGSELALFSILGAITLGAISPGPSFVMVVRTAVARSRAEGLAAALGMGCGALVFAGLAMAGLQTLLTQAPWLYLGLKIAGGAYLIYLAWRIWRGAAEPLALGDAAPQAVRGGRRAFLAALATQLSNPKAAVVYASIFAAFMPARAEPWMLFALPPLVFVIEAGWYAIVALLFSRTGPRTAYMRGKLWADRAAGAVLGALGCKLLFEAVRARA